MRVLAILAFVLGGGSFAWSASVQPHYTVEKNPLKCAGRLASWALIDLGYRGTIHLTVRRSSPSDHFTLVGELKSKTETKKLIGRIVIVATPIRDDQNKLTGFGCSYKNSEQMQFHIRVGEGDASEVVHRPQYSVEKKETKCLMVSGLQHDHNGAFENYLEYLKGEKFNLSSMACQVVDSWVEANEVIEQQKNNPNAPEIKKILFIQASHGADGGLSVSNAIDEGGDSVLSILNHHAETLPVTAIIDSCYSGDMIGRKIHYDRKHGNSKAIDNLCVMTTSSMGNSATGQFNGLDTPQQLHNKDLNHTNGLELFNSLYNVMLISSSPWEEVNLGKRVSLLGFILKDSPPDACNDFLGDMSNITQEYVDNKGQVDLNGNNYQTYLEHLATTKCTHNLDVPRSYIEMFAKQPAKLKTPAGMDLIFAAITWTDATISNMPSPFNAASRLWSKRTLNTPRIAELDQRRYKACANW